MSPELCCVKKPCCAKKEGKLVEDQHIFELLGGVNPEFQTICAQVTSQDPSPPMGMVVALLQGEESHRMVMNVKQDIVPEQSALANSNVGNTVTNTGYGGGRSRGRGGNRGGGNRSDGLGSGGQGGYGRYPNTDRDKLYYTHCGRYRHTKETCWDLHGEPRTVSATAVEVEHPKDTIEKDTSNQNWKDELLVLRRRLAALEGGSQGPSVGMTSSHNPIAFASSSPSSTWVIDSRATDHVTGVHSDFCPIVLPLKEG